MDQGMIGRPAERRCFIAAPGDTRVAPLVAALAARGWSPFLLADVARLGSSLAQAVQDAIRGADVVIGVLSDKSAAAANTSFEIGFATALGKPVVLVVPPGLALPSDLADHLYVQADLANTDAVMFALDNLDRAAAGRPAVGSVSSSARPLGGYASALLEEAKRLETAPDADFLELVVRALESGNAVAVTTAGLDRGFDIGVWSDDLDAIGANPLLLEQKRDIAPSTFRTSLNALHMTPSAKAALIVSLHAADRSSIPGLNWPILAIVLEDLLERLRDETIAEVVRDLRNRRVHGVFR